MLPAVVDSPRPRVEYRGVFHARGFVIIECPWRGQALITLLLDAFLEVLLEIIDLDRQLAAHKVQERMCHLSSHRGTGRGERLVAARPGLFVGAELIQ